MKKSPGLIDTFKGLWARGSVEDVPKDHCQDLLNVMFGTRGIGLRDGISSYLSVPNVIRMALYKPLPPFTGTNVPRIIALKSDGTLHDLLLIPSLLYTNTAMKDFGFVNFFGRCYISPNDGKVGLTGVNVKVYDGTGAAGFRDAAGASASTPLVVTTPAVTAGIMDAGTYFIAYAYETASGFVTQPSAFVYVDNFGGFSIDVTTLPTGPAGTAARWLVATKANEFRANLGVPPDVGTAQFMPLFFAKRVAGNVATTASLDFYDEQLIDDASYLLTQLATIPAGVGLLDYKGRMISYGERADPSLVRVSEIGEPEAFSSTSGFIITDPSDNSGVRCATEFRNTLYIFKQQRGYMTEDNTLEASTWPLIAFDKSIGTEQYGVAAVLDAKGSSSDGFLLADLGGLYYFNGVFVEPELSYKIRDLWLRINQTYFYLTQVSHDPINKRIYILVALDDAIAVSHVIYGDYRDGLNPSAIKWSLLRYANGCTSILTYTDFTLNIPSLVTRISGSSKIYTINIDEQGDDDSTAVESYLETALIRYTDGLSQFDKLRLAGYGPAVLTPTVYSRDRKQSFPVAAITIQNEAPGREYSELVNLVNEQASVKFTCGVLNQKYSISFLKLEGAPYSDERPR